MQHHLSPATYMVDIDDDLVVLDARAHTYFCLPAAGSDVRNGPDGVTFADPDLEREFAEAGLLSSKPTPPRVMAPKPIRDLALRVADRVRLSDLLLVWAAWATMAFSYHAAGFDRLVETARRERRADDDQPLSDDLSQLVATFERVLPWLPFQGVCLYRSFLLLRVLRWRGHDARWVFGVRTWPFNAHCWLQVGDVALDDTADRLAGLTPIMVV